MTGDHANTESGLHAYIHELRAERDAAVQAAEKARSSVKFCPSCAGAFVPEKSGYEGPCAGCKRAEQAHAALQQIADYRGEPSDSHAWDSEMRAIARAALAGNQT